LTYYINYTNQPERNMTKTIETKKTRTGALVRIQQRGKAFDVIRNSTGYAWMYVEKAVSEQRARDTMFLLTLGA
jgi:hypothetical protein